jgi:hypothetical protein
MSGAMVGFAVYRVRVAVAADLRLPAKWPRRRATWNGTGCHRILILSTVIFQRGEYQDQYACSL